MLEGAKALRLISKRRGVEIVKECKLRTNVM